MASLLSLLLLISFTTGTDHRQTRRAAEQHLLKARQYESTGDPRAEQEYRLAIQAGKGSLPEIWEELSWYYCSHLRFSEAADAQQEYINRTDYEDHADNIQTVLDLRRAADLKKSVDRVQEPSLKEIVPLSYLISRYAGFKESLGYAEKAFELYPESVDAHLLLAYNLRAVAGARERRHKILLNAVELDSNNVRAHNDLGWSYMDSWRSAEALEEFRKALDLSNGIYVEAWQGLGKALAHQSRRKEAIEALRMYLKLREPNQYNLEIEKFIQELEEALSKKPNTSG